MCAKYDFKYFAHSILLEKFSYIFCARYILLNTFAHSISCLLIICSNSNMKIKTKVCAKYKIYFTKCVQNTFVKLIFTIYCVQNTNYNIINRNRKNDVETIKIFF